MFFYVTAVVEVEEKDELFNVGEWEWVEELSVAGKRKKTHFLK